MVNGEDWSHENCMNFNTKMMKMDKDIYSEKNEEIRDNFMEEFKYKNYY